VDVHGIDASPAMVAKLRSKPGGEHVAVTLVDFADIAVDGRFRLIFVVFDTFFALPSQDDQTRCFGNVAQRLTNDGILVIEAFFPDVAPFDRGQRVGALAVETDSMHVEASTHDRVAQRVDSLHAIIEDGKVRTFPVQIRYAWPSELDLMARLAGLRLREPWGGWNAEPFTASSPGHVSVFERALTSRAL
jgi:hypothetical protein